LLHITSRDMHGALLGEVTLRLGDVYLAAFEQHVSGRELVVKVGDHTATHTDAAHGSLVLDYPEPVFEDLLADARVGAALARWDVRFKPGPARDASGEAAYDACTSSGPAYSSCCQWGSASDDHYEYRCGSGTNNVFSERECAGGGASCYSKNYAAWPFGCYDGDLAPCPAGSWAADTGWGTWGCYNNSGLVGPNGCVVAWEVYPVTACAAWWSGGGCDYYYITCAGPNEPCDSTRGCCDGYACQVWGTCG